ncbi:MAG: helix-turn-helix transcriptional regulator [Rhizomicrobium sp.]
MLLDQPDLITPARSRRLVFGAGPRVAILNARGARFEGGGDEPELSLKWIPQGLARYRSEGHRFALKGNAQLLLNRGQAYRLDMREPSESFVVFFDRVLADAAWAALSGRAEAFPEVPSVAGPSQAALQRGLAQLRAESWRVQLDGALLREQALTLLGDVAVLARQRRRMAQALPAIRRSTREEILRRAARAESYLIEAHQGATLEGAAATAALSPFHLIRVFRAAYGETPLAWAAGRRLESARDTLLLTGDPVEEIARRAGYESRTAFDRAFRRRFGATPGQIRNSGR